jgi:anaerobic ribonucleoside-triphosphate reductase activating protein
MDFNCIPPSVVFQEVPDEISLCFSITGCKVGCKGCHSTELWNEKSGIALTNQAFIQWLKKYKGLISCVVFFGGEWQPIALIEKLLIAKNFGLKTCLYSGENHIEIKISQHLNFLKTGKWQPELGGLDSITSNQTFRDLTTGEKLNHLFTKTTIGAKPFIQGANKVAAKSKTNK